MQFNFFRSLFVLTAILILSSCLNTTSVTVTSSDASFVSMTLAGNDSVKTAKFALDVTGTTIVNIDSLPYGTRIDSVYPTFSFKSTGGAKLHYPNPTGFKFKKDSAAVTGKDTVDFRQPSIWIRNYASDGKTYLNYNIQVNVHKVQPELYVWSKVTDNLSSVNATSQKSVILNDKFYYYLNDGSAAYLHTSTDGISWSSAVTPVGLPEGSALNDMIQFNGKLFMTQDRLNIYSSADGLNWTRKSVSSFNFKSLLFVLNGQLWAVVQSLNDATYHFATSTDGDVWNMIGTIPQNFPVNDFSAVSISTVTGKSKVLVVGGYSVNGALLKNSWSSEDGIYWIDFSTENHSLDSLAAGVSIISYDKKLLLFGKYYLLNKQFYRESRDEGLSWQKPSLTYNQIRQGFVEKSAKTQKDTLVYNYYEPHIYQSVVVDKNNSIFLIGGYLDKLTLSIKGDSRQRSADKNADITPTTDIWTGKLNRKSFAR
ncbi:MAG: DUF6242 domain-containing protein [Paludibacter sp.]